MRSSLDEFLPKCIFVQWWPPTTSDCPGGIKNNRLLEKPKNILLPHLPRLKWHHHPWRLRHNLITTQLPGEEWQVWSQRRYGLKRKTLYLIYYKLQGMGCTRTFVPFDCARAQVSTSLLFIVLGIYNFEDEFDVNCDIWIETPLPSPYIYANATFLAWSIYLDHSF